MSSYSEKLKDPRWQKKRLEIFERDEFTCVSCGDKKNTLVVHHKRYDSYNEPWNENEVNLVSLCEKCHKEHHDKKNLFKSSHILLDEVNRSAFFAQTHLLSQFISSKDEVKNLEFKENIKLIENIFVKSFVLVKEGDFYVSIDDVCEQFGIDNGKIICKAIVTLFRGVRVV